MTRKRLVYLLVPICLIVLGIRVYDESNDISVGIRTQHDQMVEYWNAASLADQQFVCGAYYEISFDEAGIAAWQTAIDSQNNVMGTWDVDAWIDFLGPICHK